MGSFSQHDLRRTIAQTHLRYSFVECAILLIVTACGGGGGASSNQSSAISPSVSSVSVACTPDNLARRMLASGVSFKVYAEGIPQGYLGGDTGLYVIRHNPFAMLSDVAGNPQVANESIWPFTQFSADLASGTLPEFSFIVPNIDDDAHSGAPLQADTWLQTNVITPLSNSSAFAPRGDMES
jgi:phospholipase C